MTTEAENTETLKPYQQRVHDWMMACFNDEIAFSVQEHNHRFLEEALELVQAQGCTKSEAERLVEYVYGRPAGDPVQEVGGVLVCLAALCTASEIDMGEAGETELVRIWTKVEKIRAKHAAKPQFSPLPGSTDHRRPAPVEAVDAEPAADGIWPAQLTLRDTKVFADEGQRIFTTATGYGYEERNYIRADFAAATLASIQAEAARLRKERDEAMHLVRWAHDTLYEINPSNYDHDEVCKLNDASVEVILGLAPAVGERHGKSQEWWDARATAAESLVADLRKELERLRAAALPFHRIVPFTYGNEEEVSLAFKAKHFRALDAALNAPKEKTDD